ncbi:PAS domain S-box protein [Paenibacillus alvei]
MIIIKWNLTFEEGNNIQSNQYPDMFRDSFIREAVERVGTGIVITDPSLLDNPIIYVNRGFERLTGYAAVDILGKNCRFLQGNDKKQGSVTALRDAIRNEEHIVVQLRNYRKNGEMFWNELELSPIRIGDDSKLFFVGIQKDITDRKESEQLINQYLEQIASLSTPIISINEKTSILPLIGDLTMDRFEQLVQDISTYVGNSKEDYFIIDLQGLLKYDEVVHNGLKMINDILGLMGTELIISGVQVKMAQDTITYTNGNDLNIRFFQSCKQALLALK